VLHGAISPVPSANGAALAPAAAKQAPAPATVRPVQTAPAPAAAAAAPAPAPAPVQQAPMQQAPRAQPQPVAQQPRPKADSPKFVAPPPRTGSAFAPIPTDLPKSSKVSALAGKVGEGQGRRWPPPPSCPPRVGPLTAAADSLTRPTPPAARLQKAMSGISVNEDCANLFNYIKTRSAVRWRAGMPGNARLSAGRPAPLDARGQGPSTADMPPPPTYPTYPTYPGPPPSQHKWVTYRIDDGGAEVSTRAHGGWARLPCRSCRLCAASRLPPHSYPLPPPPRPR
jgi:hypothetical protein